MYRQYTRTMYVRLFGREVGEGGGWSLAGRQERQAERNVVQRCLELEEKIELGC